MSDYSALSISAAGMSLERLKLDVTSLNVANMNTAARVGEGYKPISVNVDWSSISSFDSLLNYQSVQQLVSLNVGSTKTVYEPNHPLANEEGFVEYPDVNPLTETMNMMNATRAYEANAMHFNASKLMIDEALKLGK